ncbi:MAG: DUF2934 domain-containing protein [Verrucomicrobia bacterium]|nr:DUF2934 domain-containing protein [Verrucomicrobiota bacterium]
MATEKKKTTAKKSTAKKTVKTTVKKAAPKTSKVAAGTKKKAPAAKSTVKKTTTKPSAKKAKPAAVRSVSPQERYRMIELAAYYIAEKNGFGNDNHAYWVQAEKEIDAQLKG